MNFKGKIALVTGASGFVGANLTRRLVQSKANVHVILRRGSDLWRIEDIKQKINIHFLDITNEKKLKNIITTVKPNYIFHLATYGAYSWQENVGKMISVNIGGTLSLLKASSDVHYECFVNTGSSSEYGLKKKPMNEGMVLEPNSYYAISKSSASLLCSFFATKYKKPIVTFRLFSVYGPYEERNRLIPKLMTSAINKTKLRLVANKVARDFIYVDDVIDAYFLAVDVKNFRGEILNIGTGKQNSVSDAANYVKTVSATGLMIDKRPYQPRDWDTDAWVADISKSKKVLGWKPKYNLEQGLNETYNWFKQNMHLYKKVHKYQ